MDIHVASNNPMKIHAVKEVLEEYTYFQGKASLLGIWVDSGVSNQPKSLDETMLGAKNRAVNAFVDCAYSFGLESGMIETKHTMTGHMNLCACAIYDGKNIYFGLSPAFELPQKILNYVEEHKVEINEAVHKCGYTKDTNIGYGKGLIALLTGDRISRKDYMKSAIHFALIGLNKK